MVRVAGEGDALPLPDDPATIEPTGAAVDVLQVCHVCWCLGEQTGHLQLCVLLLLYTACAAYSRTRSWLHRMWQDDLYAAGVSAAGGCSGLLPAGDHQGILQRLVTTWSLHELTRHVCMDTQSIIVSLVPQVSPDGNPLIGAIPGVKGAYIAAGCAHMSADFQ